MLFEQYRCVKCDNTKDIDKGKITESDPGACGKCGGELRDDLLPMCPECKSRDITEKEILTFYD